MRFSFTLYIFLLAQVFATHFNTDVQDRRKLQSYPWPMQVEPAIGTCPDTSNIFDALFYEASSLCGAAIARLTPPAVCKTDSSESCPPGLDFDCIDSDLLMFTCGVNDHACMRNLRDELQAQTQIMITIAAFVTTGGFATAIGYAGKVMTALGGLNMAGDMARAQLVGEAMRDAKQAFRRTFKEHPDLLMEIVEYEFSNSIQSMDPAWGSLNEQTRQAILSTACRREADKALRLVDQQTLQRQLEAGEAFAGESTGSQASCTELFEEELHEHDNRLRDCAGWALSAIGMFDPTGLAALVQSTIDVDFCPNFNDPNDLTFNPRSQLPGDHIWHKIKEDLAARLYTDVNADHFQSFFPDSRGDGEAIFHQLRSKVLAQSCESDVSIQFSKGVCRPMNMVPSSDIDAFTLSMSMNTRTQIAYSVNVAKDQCCDKEGMTAITSREACHQAFVELHLPYSTWVEEVSDNTRLGGCLLDVRYDTVSYNTASVADQVAGFDEPICTRGTNTFATDFTPIANVQGFVIGARGQKCPGFQNVVRREDCEYALRMFTVNRLDQAILEESYEDSSNYMAHCSLRLGSVGVYNDIHEMHHDASNFFYSSDDSYPICYEEGIMPEPQDNMRLVNDHWYSDCYYWTPYECPDGYRYHRTRGDCSFWYPYSTECIKPRYECNTGTLHKGRTVNDAEASYCLLQTNFGDHNTWNGISVPCESDRCTNLEDIHIIEVKSSTVCERNVSPETEADSCYENCVDGNSDTLCVSDAGGATLSVSFEEAQVSMMTIENLNGGILGATVKVGDQVCDVVDTDNAIIHVVCAWPLVGTQISITWANGDDHLMAVADVQVYGSHDIAPERICANENSVCGCNGWVRYGMGNQWSDWHIVDGSIGCNNGVFGDPAPGTVKLCECHRDDAHTWSAAPALVVTSGSEFCQVSPDSTCVTDGAGSHNNNERCQITIHQDGVLSATGGFDVESYHSGNGCWDYFKVKDRKYCGNVGPQDVSVKAGDNMEWFTDGSVVRNGWTVCLALETGVGDEATKADRPPLLTMSSADIGVYGFIVRAFAVVGLVSVPYYTWKHCSKNRSYQTVEDNSDEI